MEENLETLRLQYKPSKILLLLVGESPPPHKGFFYDPAVREGSLSRNTKKVFEDVFGTEYSDRGDFLDDFRKKGCYLFDLFKQRGKTIRAANSGEKTSSVEELSNFLREENPETVVAVLKRISKAVEEALERAKISASYRAIPYPTRNYVKPYCSGLKETLSKS